jgi:hypothetical protein
MVSSTPSFSWAFSRVRSARQRLVAIRHATTRTHASGLP